MSLTLDALKQALVSAGLEIYRVRGDEVRVAERVRMHIMDSGVSVSLEGPRIMLTVRGQRSDFPNGRAEDLFELVRRAMRPKLEHRGFHEVDASSRNITDPVDDTSVLDVWHELTFVKQIEPLDALIEDLRWALLLPKCIEP